MAATPFFSAIDPATVRYLEYSTLCPGSRPTPLLQVDRQPGNGPPGDGPPDDGYPEEGSPIGRAQHDASPDDGAPEDGYPDENAADDCLSFVGLPPEDGGLRDYLRQGKVAELRQELNSGGKRDKNHSAKKITLKKVVANMTMSNNDMVALFPDILNCMQIPSLEIKKMYVQHRPVRPLGFDANLMLRCFLYLVNYAKMKPDVALKALPILLEVSLLQRPHSSQIVDKT